MIILFIIKIYREINNYFSMSKYLCLLYYMIYVSKTFIEIIILFFKCENVIL